MLTAGEVINEARDLHPAFDKNRQPPVIVRRALTRYLQALISKINQIDENAITLEAVTAMPLAVFADGILLPAYARNVQEVVAKDSQGRVHPIELIPAGQRGDRNTRLASAWIINGKLYLNGEAAHWRQIASVAVRYAPAAGLIATDATVLPVPDSARTAVVEALGVFMARRTPIPKESDLPPIDLADYSGRANKAEAEFLEEVGNSLTSQTFRVRDVWPR